MKKKFFKKKTRFWKITATFVLLLLIMSYACETEFFEREKQWENTTYKATIEYAKAWYENNKPEDLIFRASNGNGNGKEKTVIQIKPEWKQSFANKNSKYEVVETDLSVWGMFSITMPECMEKFEETQDVRYKLSLTRLVLCTDKSTKETQGFLMTIVPNVEFLEKSKFKPFKKACYIDRGGDFGGWIIFHNLDGSFANGWVYKKGKITGVLNYFDIDDIEISLRASFCYQIEWYLNIWNCPYWYTGGEEGYSAFCTLYSQTLLGYTYECYYYDDNNDGGYCSSCNSGSGNSSEPKVPEVKNDCSSSASTNGSTINSVLNIFGTELNAVKTNIDMLRMNAQNMSYEAGLAVQYSGGDYWVYKGQSGNLFFATGTINSITIAVNSNTYLIAHSHPSGTNPAPSPNDVMCLVNVYLDENGAKNITANVIFAYGGKEYMAYVNNRTDFVNFCNSYGSSFTQFNNGALFPSGSNWNSTYNSVFSNLKSKGFSDNDAQSYALSYVLDNSNTGIKIYEKKNGNFKEQETGTSGSNYVPKICQ